MTSSVAVIANENRKRTAKSYVPFYDDLTYVRQDALAPAGNLVFDDAAGSVVSTPGDMALYLQMLLRKGQGPRRRLVSEERFALFSKPYIKAKEFSPTASYGYGIVIDQLGGHTILRHTGGMASFMSATSVDLDAGVAAFASINAGQGYRPNPVTQFAVQLMGAQAGRKPLPKAPEVLDPMIIRNAGDYAGTYVSTNGREVAVIAEGDRLSMRVGSQSVPLQLAADDTFLATVQEWQRFPIVFGRAEKKAGDAEKNKNSPVVELMHGADWYTYGKYLGPRSFAITPGLESFVGHYSADSVWLGSTRVVLRKGRLWLDGLIPLQPLGQALFRVGDDPFNPDTVEFFYVVEGKARLIKLTGADLWRVDVA
jgi:D-alanyl-D-alanine carboxypeptidase